MYRLQPPRGCSITHQDRCLLQGLRMEQGGERPGLRGFLSISQVPPPPLQPVPNVRELKLGRLQGQRGGNLGSGPGSPQPCPQAVSLPPSGPSSAVTTAAPAGVWVPMAGRCLAAGSLGGPWHVSVKWGDRAVPWEGGNLLGPHTSGRGHWAHHVSGQVPLRAAGCLPELGWLSCS